MPTNTKRTACSTGRHPSARQRPQPPAPDAIADILRTLAAAEAHFAAGAYEPAACVAFSALTELRFALYPPDGGYGGGLPAHYYSLDDGIQPSDAIASLRAARHHLLAGDLRAAERAATAATTACILADKAASEAQKPPLRAPSARRRTPRRRNGYAPAERVQRVLPVE